MSAGSVLRPIPPLKLKPPSITAHPFFYMPENLPAPMNPVNPVEMLAATPPKSIPSKKEPVPSFSPVVNAFTGLSDRASEAVERISSTLKDASLKNDPASMTQSELVEHLRQLAIKREQQRYNSGLDPKTGRLPDEVEARFARQIKFYNDALKEKTRQEIKNAPVTNGFVQKLFDDTTRLGSRIGLHATEGPRAFLAGGMIGDTLNNYSRWSRTPKKGWLDNAVAFGADLFMQPLRYAHEAAMSGNILEGLLNNEDAFRAAADAYNQIAEMREKRMPHLNGDALAATREMAEASRMAAQLNTNIAADIKREADQALAASLQAAGLAGLEFSAAGKTWGPVGGLLAKIPGVKTIGSKFPQLLNSTPGLATIGQKIKASPVANVIHNTDDFLTRTLSKPIGAIQTVTASLPAEAPLAVLGTVNPNFGQYMNFSYNIAPPLETPYMKVLNDLAPSEGLGFGYNVIPGMDTSLLSNAEIIGSTAGVAGTSALINLLDNFSMSGTPLLRGVGRAVPSAAVLGLTLGIGDQLNPYITPDRLSKFVNEARNTPENQRTADQHNVLYSADIHGFESPTPAIKPQENTATRYQPSGFIKTVEVPIPERHKKLSPNGQLENQNMSAPVSSSVPEQNEGPNKWGDIALAGGGLLTLGAVLPLLLHNRNRQKNLKQLRKKENFDASKNQQFI